MRKGLILGGAVVGAVLAATATLVVTRALTLESRQLDVEPAPRLDLDEGAAAQRLAGMLRLPTVAGTGDPEHRQAFVDLHDYLEITYPKLHEALARETISELGLLYTWRGSDRDADPIVLMAHLDVVPVADDELDAWSHPPFSGAVAEGYVWGRGALDNKGSVTGIFEAVERLLEEGFSPRRTVYLALGHDEEIGGHEGAAAIARRFEEEGVRPYLVLDEGGLVVEGMLPVDAPVALIGVAEKGYLTLELRAEGPAGHSSMPAAQTAIGILSSAIVRLEASPFPGRLDGVPREMLVFLAPEMPWAARLPLANLWLFRPLVERQFEADPGTASTLRTTMAPTVLRAGDKENVLPSRARALINFRIRSGDTVEDVVERVRGVIRDPRVAVGVPDSASFPPSDASPISPTEGPVFELLQRTVHEVYPDAVVVPYLLPGATDSRHFSGLTEHVYRFAPGHLMPDDLERIHGINERIAVADLAAGIRLYYRLLHNAAR
jgi:carboxypeptidase PM20D1